MIEYYAGNFPLWLAPDQVRILTIGDELALVNYARKINNELRTDLVRPDVDLSTDKIKGKIRDGLMAKFSAPSK